MSLFPDPFSKSKPIVSLILFRYKQVSILFIILFCIAVYYIPFNLRNEKSSIAGKQLSEIPFIARKVEQLDNPKMEAAAKRMAGTNSARVSIMFTTIYDLLKNVRKFLRNSIIRDNYTGIQPTG